MSVVAAIAAFTLLVPFPWMMFQFFSCHFTSPPPPRDKSCLKKRVLLENCSNPLLINELTEGRVGCSASHCVAELELELGELWTTPTPTPLPRAWSAVLSGTPRCLLAFPVVPFASFEMFFMTCLSGVLYLIFCFT